MLTRSSSVQAAKQWGTVDPLEECRRALHKEAFAAHHPLAGHPLFSIESLTKVAEEAAKRKDDIYVDAGDLSLADKWGTTPSPDMTISEIIDRIDIHMFLLDGSAGSVSNRIAIRIILRHQIVKRFSP